ncbi:MAG: PKD domain-containing protein [Acidimicrobiales bacterium]
MPTWRRLHRPAAQEERGFTLIEMVVTLTIIGGVFLSLSFVMFGSLRALGAARQRSIFTDLANKEMESLRSLPYDDVGARSDDLATYTGTPPQHEGRDAVVIDVVANPGTLAPPAVSVVTTSPIQGITVPYTVRRWVTWTDPGAGTGHKFKRLHVKMEWSENGRSTRRIDLASVLFPGNLGTNADNTNPTADFTFTPPTGIIAGSTAVTFSASATDPDPGASFSYLWNFGDGGTASGVTVTHTFSAPGNPWSVVMVASDGQGGSHVVTKPVVVNSVANNPPYDASFTVTPATGEGPLTVTVDAAASDDDDAQADLTYHWDFGDGTVLSTSSDAVPHTYPAVNAVTVYSISLTVTDPGGGATAALPQTVTVEPGPCTITSASFQQQNNLTTNDVKVQTNGKPRSSQKSFTFNVRTSDQCLSVAGRLPMAGGGVLGGTNGVTLGTVVGAPPGYQDWRGTGTVGGADQFDLTNGARRTWDAWSPATTGAIASSPAFTVTVG